MTNQFNPNRVSQIIYAASPVVRSREFTARKVLVAEPGDALFQIDTKILFMNERLRGVEMIRLVTSASIAQPGLHKKMWTIVTDQDNIDRAVQQVTDYDPRCGIVEFVVDGHEHVATVWTWFKRF